MRGAGFQICICSSLQTHQDPQSDLAAKAPRAPEQLFWERFGPVIAALHNQNSAALQPQELRKGRDCGAHKELHSDCACPHFSFKKHLHFSSSLANCRTWGLNSLFCRLEVNPAPQSILLKRLCPVPLHGKVFKNAYLKELPVTPPLQKKNPGKSSAEFWYALDWKWLLTTLSCSCSLVKGLSTSAVIDLPWGTPAQNSHDPQ